MQVCSYRCIASHETAQFEAFSLCILQKNNCLGLNVKIPPRPSPSPMTAFRGESLSHASAEQLFIGWLGAVDYCCKLLNLRSIITLVRLKLPFPVRLNCFSSVSSDIEQMHYSLRSPGISAACGLLDASIECVKSLQAASNGLGELQEGKMQLMIRCHICSCSCLVSRETKGLTVKQYQ